MNIYKSLDVNQIMKFKKITVKNFGPISSGTIERKKISVFFGSNNSGKSLISRLIHGVNSLDMSLSGIHPVLKREIRNSKIDSKYVYSHFVLSTAGLSKFDAITHGQKSGIIDIDSKLTIRLDRQRRTRIPLLYTARMSRSMNKSRHSVYVPAGRAGMIQFFTNIIQARNNLLRLILNVFGERGMYDSKSHSAKSIQDFTKHLGDIPEHLEQFYDLILSAQRDKLDENIRESFSKLFEGSIDVSDYRGLPTMIYKDPIGFNTAIESAGSGAVSSFPIVAGIHYVESGGSLIIEEPEVHLEPSRQLRLIEQLHDIAVDRKINLIFTTHSDYVVKQLLALVSGKKIRHSDLGLYYFNRKSPELTTIDKILVDKTGEAEQPLFQEAMDDLITQFSE